MGDRLFGEIEGFPEGTLFDSRKALNEAGVHRPTQGGISGSAKEGADSIVLSGGYEDDLDYGDLIVYTGHGGRDPKTGPTDRGSKIHWRQCWSGSKQDIGSTR